MIRKFFGRQTVRLARGRTYVATIAFILSGLVYVRVYNLDKLLGLTGLQTNAVGLIGGLAFTWLVGFLDERYGVFKEELRHLTTINPVLDETLKNTKEIKKRLMSK